MFVFSKTLLVYKCNDFILKYQLTKTSIALTHKRSAPCFTTLLASSLIAHPLLFIAISFLPVSLVAIPMGMGLVCFCSCWQCFWEGSRCLSCYRVVDSTGELSLAVSIFLTHCQLLTKPYEVENKHKSKSFAGGTKIRSYTVGCLRSHGPL